MRSSEQGYIRSGRCRYKKPANKITPGKGVILMKGFGERRKKESLWLKQRLERDYSDFEDLSSRKEKKIGVPTKGYFSRSLFSRKRFQDQ